MNFSTSVSIIPGVGSAFQKKLKNMGIATVRDLLFYFPRSYEDLSLITPIGNVREQTNVCIEGIVLDMQEVRTFKKHMHLATGIIQDASGSLRILWFNQPYIATTLKKGERVCLAGKIVRDKQGLYLSNPAYELLDARERLHTGRIIPIYQETTGVSSKWLRRVIWSVMKSVPKEDILPQTIVQKRGLLSFSEALYEMHFPFDLRRIEQARTRFAFEELFVISLFVLSERKKLARVKAHMIPLNKELMARFTKSLPFRLTDAQKKALAGRRGIGKNSGGCHGGIGYGKSGTADRVYGAYRNSQPPAFCDGRRAPQHVQASSRIAHRKNRSIHISKTSQGTNRNLKNKAHAQDPARRH